MHRLRKVATNDAGFTVVVICLGLSLIWYSIVFSYLESVSNVQHVTQILDKLKDQWGPAWVSSLERHQGPSRPYGNWSSMDTNMSHDENSVSRERVTFPFAPDVRKKKKPSKVNRTKRARYMYYDME